MMKNRTRRTLRVGDRFAYASGHNAMFVGTAHLSRERWHTVGTIGKRREVFSGELTYHVNCASCGNYVTLYANARIDVIRER